MHARPHDGEPDDPEIHHRQDQNARPDHSRPEGHDQQPDRRGQDRGSRRRRRALHPDRPVGPRCSDAIPRGERQEREHRSRGEAEEQEADTRRWQEAYGRVDPGRLPNLAAFGPLVVEHAQMSTFESCLGLLLDTYERLAQAKSDPGVG